MKSASEVKNQVDVSGILAGATEPDKKGQKSKARIYPISCSQCKPDEPCAKCVKVMGRIDKIVEAKRKLTAAKSELESENEAFSRDVLDWRIGEQKVDDQYIPSVRAFSPGMGSVLLSWAAKFSKVAWKTETVAAVKKIVGAKFDIWFKKGVKITVRKAWCKEVKLQELIALVGEKKFAEIFTVDLAIEPTAAFTENHEVELSKAKLVQLHKIGFTRNASITPSA